MPCEIEPDAAGGGRPEDTAAWIPANYLGNLSERAEQQQKLAREPNRNDWEWQDELALIRFGGDGNPHSQ